MTASFAKDQAAFYRSQGWKNLDDKNKARNKYIYDQILSSAGDDKSLTHDEYKNIFSNRGNDSPWGKYAYSRDSIASALAEAGTSGGIKLDSNARYMRDNDLAFDGDDLLLRASGGWDEFDDDLRSSGKASYERREEDGQDDYWNIYRFKGVPAVVEKEEEIEEEVVKPIVEEVVDTTPTGPDTILDEARADWEENANPTRKPDPKVGGRGLQDALPIQMDRWMNIGVNPGRRLGVDLTPMEQLGSIPFVTAGQYDQSLNKTIPTRPGGRFYGFLQPQDGFGKASSMAAGLLEDMRATI